jgi:HEAT repeat protein
VSRVRGHALAVLDQACARAPETDAAMSAALGDPDPEVRLLAALSRPEAGRPVLEELAALREAADWCSARAVEGLGEGLTLDAGRRALESARSAGKLKTAVAVILPVARAGGVEAVVSALADPSHAVATAAALALGAVNARDAEEALLKSLARPTDDFRVAAAHALGSIGTVRAVLPLKELERQGGAVSRAAREAVARIQAGLTGATPGQVSLSEADPSGNVSLAEDTGGRVTLASDGRTSKG